MQPLVGSDYKPPKLVVPAKWSLAADKGDTGLIADSTSNLARWWQQLGDLQLNQFINAALAGNLD